MYLLYSILLSVNLLTSYCFLHQPLNYLSKENIKTWYKNFTRNMSSTNPYCSVCCVDTTKSNLTKICGKHTMCIYKSGQYGAGCKGVLDIPFQQQEIEVIVDTHNTLRNRIALGLEDRGNPGPQPPASNMREMEWNNELAEVAQRWASQCTYAHDLCRDLERYPVGQNIAKGTFATNYDISFIAAWYDQVQWINEFDLRAYQITLMGSMRHYTQLVWAETYQIGCARAVFLRYNGAKTSYRQHFVCNYGPTGNIPGQPVYKKGKPCSKCPTKTFCSNQYKGLCGKSENVDNKIERNVQLNENNVQIKSQDSNRGSKYYLSPILFFVWTYIINA